MSRLLATDSHVIRCVSHLAPSIAKIMSVQWRNTVAGFTIVNIPQAIGLAYVNFVENDYHKVTYHERRMMRSMARGIALGIADAQRG